MIVGIKTFIRRCLGIATADNAPCATGSCPRRFYGVLVIVAVGCVPQAMLAVLEYDAILVMRKWTALPDQCERIGGLGW